MPWIFDGKSKYFYCCSCDNSNGYSRCGVARASGTTHSVCVDVSLNKRWLSGWICVFISVFVCLYLQSLLGTQSERCCNPVTMEWLYRCGLKIFSEYQKWAEDIDLIWLKILQCISWNCRFTALTFINSMIFDIVSEPVIVFDFLLSGIGFIFEYLVDLFFI